MTTGTAVANKPAYRSNQEYQSGLMRLAGWAVMVSYIGYGLYTGSIPTDPKLFYVLFGLHFVWFVAIVVHVMVFPRFMQERTYVGVVGDLSGTTFAIYLSGDPISPFFLIYIWSFLSQGSRFGKKNLIVASVGSVVCYGAVTTVLGGWTANSYEAWFFLAALVILPIYQYTLIKQLQEAKDEALRANEARGNFLATMTHELRTPLSGVIGMTRLLDSTELNDEQRDYVESIGSSAHVLQSLIGDILDLSKIDAQKLEMKPVEFDLRDSLVEICNALSNQSLDKGVEMVCAVEPDVPRLVWGDDLRFRQIIFNLVGNAVKFTEQGHILVRAAVEQKNDLVGRRHLLVEVVDTGIGIAPGKVRQIFDSFWQADDSTTKRYGGTGLGTTIARDLTRLMEGAIGVDSTAGEGSRFWVRLPILQEGSTPPPTPEVLRGRSVVILETDTEAAKALTSACVHASMRARCLSGVDELFQHKSSVGEPADLLVVADSPRGLDVEGLAAMLRRSVGLDDVPILYLQYPRRPLRIPDSRSDTLSKPFNYSDLWRQLARLIDPNSVPAVQRQAPSPLLQSVDEGRGAHVLVAEDEAINAKLIRSLLDKANHRVTLVRDGQAALDAAVVGEFDLALIDLRMPKLDGFEFTRAYRDQEQGRHLPIIALTANAAEDAKKDCLDAGMDDFLTKPVDPVKLDVLLERFAPDRAGSL